MIIPPVTASNPYLDFAQGNNLNYGDVLNYVGIMDGVKLGDWSYWYDQAAQLPDHVKDEINRLKDNLKKYYFKNV